MLRNPTAFETKFKKMQLQGLAGSGGGKGGMNGSKSGGGGMGMRVRVEHKVGCKCRRSACLKKYCECFHAQVKCSDTCRCVGCKNMPNDGTGRGRSKNAASAASAVATTAASASTGTASGSNAIMGTLSATTASLRKRMDRRIESQTLDRGGYRLGNFTNVMDAAQNLAFLKNMSPPSTGTGTGREANATTNTHNGSAPNSSSRPVLSPGASGGRPRNLVNSMDHKGVVDTYTTSLPNHIRDREIKEVPSLTVTDGGHSSKDEEMSPPTIQRKTLSSLSALPPSGSGTSINTNTKTRDPAVNALLMAAYAMAELSGTPSPQKSKPQATSIAKRKLSDDHDGHRNYNGHYPYASNTMSGYSMKRYREGAGMGYQHTSSDYESPIAIAGDGSKGSKMNTVDTTNTPTLHYEEPPDTKSTMMANNDRSIGTRNKICEKLTGQLDSEVGAGQ